MLPPSDRQTLSLWNLVDSLQRKLEGQGLDTAVVDVAVTRGVEALLRRRRRPAPLPAWVQA